MFFFFKPRLTATSSNLNIAFANRLEFHCGVTPWIRGVQLVENVFFQAIIRGSWNISLTHVVNLSIYQSLAAFNKSQEVESKLKLVQSNGSDMCEQCKQRNVRGSLKPDDLMLVSIQHICFSSCIITSGIPQQSIQPTLMTSFAAKTQICPRCDITLVMAAGPVTWSQSWVAFNDGEQPTNREPLCLP